MCRTSSWWARSPRSPSSPIRTGRASCTGPERVSASCPGRPGGDSISTKSARSGIAAAEHRFVGQTWIFDGAGSAATASRIAKRRAVRSRNSKHFVRTFVSAAAAVIVGGKWLANRLQLRQLRRVVDRALEAAITAICASTPRRWPRAILPTHCGWSIAGCCVSQNCATPSN